MQNDVATLEADDSQTINWYVDAAFAVHADFKSHTGAVMTLGKGIVISISTKQKVNTRSSTESELVGIDDAIAKMLWTKLMIEAQGFKVKNLPHRDNTSSMKLEENGKSSSVGQKQCVGRESLRIISHAVEKVSVKKTKTTCTNKSILSKGSGKEILKAKKPKSE
eukprot:scaffold103282_cov47-Attheya_sp.AAC.1